MSLAIEKLVIDSVKKLTPYSSARDEFNGGDIIFLDANESATDLDYNRYPDPYQRNLKREIAKWRDSKCEQIFLGNGSDEIIDLLIKMVCNRGEDRILTFSPSYGMYTVSANINQIGIDYCPLNSDFQVDLSVLTRTVRKNHKLVFVCSPNNPNGGLIHPDVVIYLLENTESIVVVDEAYIDFSSSASWLSELDKYDRLVVLQTFSKGLGGAGLRLGIGFMNSILVSYLNKIKPPYNISAPVQELALKRLSHLRDVESQIELTIAERKRVANTLNEMDHVKKVFPSEANFLLVRVGNAKKMYHWLLENGVVVRGRSRQYNCEECLRITIGKEEENNKLLTLMSAYK